MIVVRDVLQIDPEHMQQAKEWAKESRELGRKLGGVATSRVLCDLVGNYYTMVFEHEAPSLAEYEANTKKMMAHPEWQQSYGKMRKAVRGGHREIFSVID